MLVSRDYFPVVSLKVKKYFQQMWLAISKKSKTKVEKGNKNEILWGATVNKFGQCSKP